MMMDRHLLGSTLAGGGPVEGGLGAVTGGGGDEEIAISDTGVEEADVDVAGGAPGAIAVLDSVTCCGCGAASYPTGLL